MAVPPSVIPRPAELIRKLQPYCSVFGSSALLDAFISRLQSGREVRLRVCYTEAQRPEYDAVLGLLNEAVGIRASLKVVQLESRSNGEDVYAWTFTTRRQLTTADWL